MRAALAALAAVALVAVVIIGLNQVPESSSPGQTEQRSLSTAEVERRLAGAPPKLAALHREANRILPGAGKGFRRRLAELRGHPVVVNIWASWCGPCREELPVLQRVSAQMGKQVAFLGLDLQDDKAAALRLLRKLPVTYPSYEDPGGRVFDSYRIKGVPSTIYYDARGKQSFVHQGPYLTEQDLVGDVRRYALGAGT
jgi:thiol-disulfide isomerase/thioredoxin